MHAELLLKAFEKAQTDTGSDGLHRRAKFLSEEIQERTGQPYGERSLRNYYKHVQEGNKDFELPHYVVDGLVKYLGHDSYRDFLDNMEGMKRPIASGNGNNKRVWIYLVILGVFLIGGWIVYDNPFQTQMMIWKEDHYEVVPMDLDKYNLTDLKEINQERLDNFRKVEPDCEYEFFNGNGLELLWYGKNPEGDLEYFTDLGRHPETGKTLDPITEYMIKKYICPTYPD